MRFKGFGLGPLRLRKGSEAVDIGFKSLKMSYPQTLEAIETSESTTSQLIGLAVAVLGVTREP
jgi:hypothetical protein